MIEQGEHAEELIEEFNAGEVIIEHVSNSSLDHPIIELPTVLGINFLCDQACLDALAGGCPSVRGFHLVDAEVPEARAAHPHRIHERPGKPSFNSFEIRSCSRTWDPSS